MPQQCPKTTRQNIKEVVGSTTYITSTTLYPDCAKRVLEEKEEKPTNAFIKETYTLPNDGVFSQPVTISTGETCKVKRIGQEVQLRDANGMLINGGQISQNRSLLFYSGNEIKGSTPSSWWSSVATVTEAMENLGVVCQDKKGTNVQPPLKAPDFRAVFVEPFFPDAPFGAARNR